MADPLSISAGIIAVLQLTGTLVQYLNDVRDAPKERLTILVEVSGMSGILFLLKDAAERREWDDTSLATMTLLSEPNGPLDQFKAALEELTVKLAPHSKLRPHHSMLNRVNVCFFPASALSHNFLRIR